MKLGVMGARADSRGLARQTQSFAKWLQPSRVFGVDMTADNLSPYPCDWSPYLDGGADLTVMPNSQITEELARSWMRGLDVVLGAECFYRNEFVEWARDEGVRTVLQINPEFSAFHAPKNPDPSPDVLLNPTTWLMDRLPGAYHLPCPVDRQEFPFRLRTEARHFVHVAGHRAMADRAGTQLVYGMLARKHVGDVTIRSQTNIARSNRHRNAVVEDQGVADPRYLYHDADVVLLLRRYGGQSLAMNEALSSGCPVIILDREPENTWGGVFPIPCRTKSQMRTKGGMVPVFDGGSQHLIMAMKKLYDTPDTVETLSREADAYAETISWDRLLPVYEEFLRCVVKGDDPDRVLCHVAAFRETHSSDI